MSNPRSEAPAIAKIRDLLESRDLSINAFERAIGLSTGAGSRILRGAYLPGAPVLLRVRVWSRGEVDLPDWLTAEELGEAQRVAPVRRTRKAAA